MQRSNKPAELIAKFVDGELRAGSKASSPEELEHILDQALLLFRYISVRNLGLVSAAAAAWQLRRWPRQSPHHRRASMTCWSGLAPPALTAG